MNNLTKEFARYAKKQHWNSLLTFETWGNGSTVTARNLAHKCLRAYGYLRQKYVFHGRFVTFKCTGFTATGK